MRATLFWTANPVLIQELVSGGHLDTLVAAAAICAIQVARRVSGIWGDVLVGVLIGLACGVKINAVLIALGLAWPLLRRHEWMRTTRIAAVALATVALQYSCYGLGALKPLFGGLQAGHAALAVAVLRADRRGARRQPRHTMATVISCLWPIAMIIVAWLIYRRISSDQPREVVAPFALTYAWILVAPWVFAWYTGDRLGRADPGAAQPDDPLADASSRSSLPCAIPAAARRVRDPLITPPGDRHARKKPGRADSADGQARAGPAAGRPRCTRPRPALRRHWLAAVLLAAGLVLRVLAQFAYRPALFYIDTTRYLYNDAPGMDPVGYKGPLRAILAVANFDAVAAVQHLLGLAMAVVLYLLLLRRGVPRWLAALAIAPVLLDAYQLQIEQTIMPDIWFEALIVAGLAILLWRPAAGLAAAVAAGLVLGSVGHRRPGRRGADRCPP